MNLRPDPGLTFDDVLLVPKYSDIRSRKDVDTSTWLAPGIRLHIPILSANMDTVTEANMAIAMAQQGGLGVLHRFMSIERMVEMVRKVKRAESMVVLTPLTILPTATVAEARRIMAEEEIGGLVVVDDAQHLLGLVTTRDVLLAPNPDAPVSTVMTPRERLIVASENESLEAAREKLYTHRIEKLPLVDGENRLAGLITVQDIVKIQQHPYATKDALGRLRVGVAIGVKPEEIERAAACVEAGADILVLDIAHGHSENALRMVRTLKQKFPAIPLIAGNVATAEGVRDLVKAGADAVKVGVGAGSICTTRIVTGCGVPQLTAVAECAAEGHRLNVPIIADGGMRTSGDVTKALAAGASAVMLGNMLAGTEESPGPEVVRQGRRYKVVRGMASLTANVERRRLERRDDDLEEEEWSEVVPEGVEALVPYRGKVKDILHQIVGGLRSGMSYVGAHNLPELWERAEFIRITPAGKAESGAHDVELI